MKTAQKSPKVPYQLLVWAIVIITLVAYNTLKKTNEDTKHSGNIRTSQQNTETIVTSGSGAENNR